MSSKLKPQTDKLWVPCGHCLRQVLASHRKKTGYLPRGWIESGALAYCSPGCVQEATKEADQRARERNDLVARNLGEHALVDPWSLDPERAKRLEPDGWEAYCRREPYDDFRQQLAIRRNKKTKRFYLTPNEVEFVLEALSGAARWAEHEKQFVSLLRSFTRAREAWNRKKDKNGLRIETNDRANEVAKILFPRRIGEHHGRKYDPVYVALAYQDFTTGRISRPAFDADSGSWLRKSWSALGLAPPATAKPNDRVQLPLTRMQALTAIVNHFGFPTEKACYEYLRVACKVSNLPEIDKRTAIPKMKKQTR